MGNISYDPGSMYGAWGYGPQQTQYGSYGYGIYGLGQNGQPGSAQFQWSASVGWSLGGGLLVGGLVGFLLGRAMG